MIFVEYTVQCHFPNKAFKRSWNFIINFCMQCIYNHVFDSEINFSQGRFSRIINYYSDTDINHSLHQSACTRGDGDRNVTNVCHARVRHDSKRTRALFINLKKRALFTKTRSHNPSRDVIVFLRKSVLGFFF